jgi:signal transduction histidine kinase
MLEALMGHILRHRQTSYIAITAAQIFVVLGLWESYSHTVLLGWLFAMQAMALPHFLTCRRYAGKQLTREQVRFLKTFFVVYALFSSSLWGALGWLLDATWDISAFFILMPMLGIFAGAINLAAILPVYFSLVTPILLQSMAVLLFTDAANLVLAGFFTIYYLGMINFSLELNKMLIRTYRLQFDLESANRDLVVQKRAAEKANKEKSRFLAAASHDLRQPLYAMELFLGGLAQDYDDSRKEYLLSRLRSALDSMQRMFSSLLDMSRFDAGIIKPVKKNFSADSLLTMLKLKFEDEALKKGLQMSVRMNGHWVFSDPILIQRVLENFMANAIKFTDEGWILATCRRRGRALRFEVWDTGKGMEEAEIEGIFDAFHQLENPERDRRKGVGLGLSIVDQIANLLEAPVRVRSHEGRGSVFSIEVPPGEVEQEAPAASAASTAVDPQVFVDLAVWVIDDDPDILEGLQLQLESWGCISRTFETPEQVLALLERDADAPELLISDLRLRNHRSGVEVIEMVADHYGRFIPSVIITGDTGPVELRQLSRTGISLLHKPVTEDKLQSRMAELLVVSSGAAKPVS